MNDLMDISARGGCLCSAVRYEVRGPLRGIANCHCSKCRRFHGNFAAYLSLKRAQLTLTAEDDLRWYRSVKDETPGVHRGFCGQCGSSLFWDPRGQDRIAVAAGSLDLPTGLEIIGHVWLSQAGDWYRVDDGRVRYAHGWGSDAWGAEP